MVKAKTISKLTSNFPPLYLCITTSTSTSCSNKLAKKKGFAGSANGVVKFLKFPSNGNTITEWFSI